MDDFAMAQKYQAALSVFDHLDRSIATAEAAHLQHIGRVEKVRRLGRCLLRSLNRREQIVADNWFRKNLRVRDIEPTFVGRVIREKQDLESGKNLAQRRADPVLARVPVERRPTLIAQPTNRGYAFDVHIQGDRETVFFAV